MLIDIIASERADFIKITPVINAILKEQNNGSDLRYRLIYTGRHNDRYINKTFFDQLNIRKPDVNLEVATGTDTEQTATLMVRYEKTFGSAKPDVMINTGDANGSIACSLAAKKNNVVICRLEAGLRNNNHRSKEENNRVVADAIADYYFTSSQIANEHLRYSGVADERMFFVGNTTADLLQRFRELYQRPPVWERLSLQPQQYYVIAVNKPANIEPARIKAILGHTLSTSRGLPVIYPMTMNTAKLLEGIGLRAPNLFVTELLEYVHFNYLVQHAKVVITDSGGVQEEATMLHVPCITPGRECEREETVVNGTNELVPVNELPEAFDRINNGDWKKGNIPYMWDGRASERIAIVLKNMERSFVNAQKKTTKLNF